MDAVFLLCVNYVFFSFYSCLFALDLKGITNMLTRY